MLTRGQVERVVKEHFGEGQKFQSREVREKLGLSGSDNDGIARLHNYLKAMEKEGRIQRLPGDQKRNIFFILNMDFEARERMGQIDAMQGKDTSKGPDAQSVRPIDRLGRIEDALRAIHQRIDSVENKLDKALMVWL